MPPFFICTENKVHNESKIFMKVGLCCKIGKKRVFFVFYAHEFDWEKLDISFKMVNR